MKAKRLYSYVLVPAIVFIAAILFLQAGSAWCANLVDDTREAMRAGKYSQALKLIEAALDVNPTDVNAHLMMTEYSLALQDYNSAELATERTLVLNRSYAPLVAQAYFVAGQTAQNRKQSGQALALYETAVALDPEFKSKVKGRYMAVGNDLLGQRKIDTALSAYNQEISVNPGAKKSVADGLFVYGRSLLGNNDRGADTLFSYVVSLYPSYGPNAAKARLEYGMDLLSRARAATGEERWRLREQSLRYVSKEAVDQAVPPPVWNTVFKQEYTGRGMNDEDGVMTTPLFGTDVKPGDRIVVTGREFQFYDNGWKTYKGSLETINRTSTVGKRVGIRARRGEMIALEVQRPIDMQ